MVTNIEHLFQRLNNQGTPLDSEELAYSVLKAYLPEVAEPIESLPFRPMASSRLASFGMRLALFDASSGHSQTSLSISAIRKIVAARTQDEERKKKAITDFFESGLIQTIEIVESWLRFDTTKNRLGAIRYQRTSISYHSPEVYFLLMCWANEIRLSGQNGSKMASDILAIALILHIYGGGKQHTFVEKLLKKTSGRLGRADLGKVFRDISADEESRVLLYDPERLAAELRVPRSDEALKNWDLWATVVCDNNEDRRPIGDRESTIWPFIAVTLKSRDLLMYAQREYLAERFKEYDPSDKLNFEDQNRPWDYDHILASKFTYYRQGEYQPVATFWVNCIGNLRAWPSEDNRSDQAQTADSKITDGEMKKSYILDDAELGAFSCGDSVRRSPEAVRMFVNASKRRLVRIYKEWFETLQVEKFIVKT